MELSRRGLIGYKIRIYLDSPRRSQHEESTPYRLAFDHSNNITTTEEMTSIDSP